MVYLATAISTTICHSYSAYIILQTVYKHYLNRPMVALNSQFSLPRPDNSHRKLDK